MGSSSIVVKGYAKLNLYLDVVGKRPDGYHDIETVFQSVSLHDTLKLVSGSTDIEVLTEHPAMPPQEENLVYKAASVFQQETEIHRGVSIVLEKNIPIGAGLGGGSADAAAALAGLNLLWDTNLNDETLLKMALRVGSDVPFCLTGGRAVGLGRGERLTGLPVDTPLWFVLVTPPFSVSTGDIYASLKARPVQKESDGEISTRFGQVVERVRSGNVADVLYNALEHVVVKRHPELKLLKRELKHAGCVSVVMTGSGPTVYGLVPSQEEGNAIVDRVKRTRPDHFVTLARSSAVGWERVSVPAAS